MPSLFVVYIFYILLSQGCMKVTLSLKSDTWLKMVISSKILYYKLFTELHLTLYNKHNLLINLGFMKILGNIQQTLSIHTVPSTPSLPIYSSLSTAFFGMSTFPFCIVIFAFICLNVNISQVSQNIKNKTIELSNECLTIFSNFSKKVHVTIPYRLDVFLPTLRSEFTLPCYFH